MSIFIYVCYRAFGLDVSECCMFIICVCSSLELFFSFCLFVSDFFLTQHLKKKKGNLVKTFCKNGIVNTALCYMLFFHGRKLYKMQSNKIILTQLTLLFVPVGVAVRSQ